MDKIINILEISSLYDDETAIWFIKNSEFPSQLKYRNRFSVVKEVWDKWIADNITILKTEAREDKKSGKMEKFKYIGFYKGNNNVIVSWTDSEVINNKLTIAAIEVKYIESDPKFSSEEFDKEILSMKITEDRKSSVYMVVQRQHGLDLQDFDIEIPVLDVNENYGAEWAAKHEQLLEALSIKKKKGIALLHGLPGTGKSMYIRHLIALLAESRTVIYLPNQLISCITDPGFLPLMAEYSNSILVIEDADEAIKSRKTGGTSVDKLLNLADGIISDFLGTQIICTFNNDISLIDDALLRKGRLIVKHEFGKLSVEAAQKLSDKLGFKNKIEDPMTLAEIYNQEDRLSDIEKKNTKIGFGR